jgi:hypothetical protein
MSVLQLCVGEEGTSYRSACQCFQFQGVPSIGDQVVLV